jgi:diguanylate cyclase (GGDEF)-like protein
MPLFGETFSSLLSALDRKKRPVMARAVIFIFLVCLSLVAMGGWNRWNARANLLAKTETATSNMALALAQHAAYTIKSADLILLGMVERMEKSGGMGATVGDGFHDSLARRVEALSSLDNLIVYDAQGNLHAQAQKTVPGAMNQSSREYFIYHRDHLDRNVHIGPPVWNFTTEEWVFTVTRRINRADGGFAGVALASIRMTHFRDFYDSFDIGRAGAIFLALDDGTLLARRPFSHTLIGSDVGGGPIFREYRARGPVGAAMLKSSLDNTERLYSYRHLDAYPLVVGMALAKEEIFANWWADTYRLAGGMSLLVAILGMLGFRLIRQISRREQLEAELRKAKDAMEVMNKSLETLAMQDGLTGLANRRHFEEILSTEFHRAKRNGSSLALIMLDVDFFKHYNDTHGHPAGDECLRSISQVLKHAQRRAGDLAARYGGEELALLLPGTDAAGAMAVAEKVRLAVQDLLLPHPVSLARVVTISAGVAAWSPSHEGGMPLDLVQAADLSLYEAKNKGRNRICCRARTPRLVDAAQQRTDSCASPAIGDADTG